MEDGRGMGLCKQREGGKEFLFDGPLVEGGEVSGRKSLTEVEFLVSLVGVDFDLGNLFWVGRY